MVCRVGICFIRNLFLNVSLIPIYCDLCILSLSMVNLTERQLIRCDSHDVCPDDQPFCNTEGLCDLCSDCHYCQDGVDGTCGSCGDGYPTQEIRDCTGTAETTGNMLRTFYTSF